MSDITTCIGGVYNTGRWYNTYIDRLVMVHYVIYYVEFRLP